MKDWRSRFGFHTTPFTREIAVRERYKADFLEEAILALARVATDRMSGALIAPAGAGKTAVLRALVEEHLPEARYRVHYVKVSDLSKRDMCREIAFAAGVPPAGAYNYLIRNLQDRYLAFSESDGLRPVLLIDDAHELRPDVLGVLRVLTNFEMDSRLVLSIILSGQPPLRDLLRRGDLEDVAKRLVHYATLRLLSRPETEAYVAHRSSAAGAITVPFDATAIDAIFEIGHGNLRATDTLAMKALEVAHQQSAATVDHNHVINARKVLWP
ncbi:MAG: AAA family ATPase [Planctomycetes bacterium]|nr:AAA family ATPase [Planctomycetota bacterium]